MGEPPGAKSGNMPSGGCGRSFRVQVVERSAMVEGSDRAIGVLTFKDPHGQQIEAASGLPAQHTGHRTFSADPVEVRHIGTDYGQPMIAPGSAHHFLKGALRNRTLFTIGKAPCRHLRSYLRKNLSPYSTQTVGACFGTMKYMPTAAATPTAPPK